MGIKDTIDSVAHLRSMVLTVKAAHPQFVVLCGYDDHLFNTLLLGGDGAISASGNFAPQVSVNLLQAFRDGELAGQRSIIRLCCKFRRCISWIRRL